ncbi:MAG: ATP-dependent helicase [Lachnospiraceae bacterium]|nr:ATP-dependent helicase [Lachnospiraceae bacterium]
MKQPSKIQLQAIKHLRGPAQIVAGPGSGKTFTIIKRILYLTEHHHISPSQILVITFTKAAALEMKERYESALSSAEQVCGHVNFGTFHSICYHILQKSGGFHTDSLIRESDKRKIIGIILANHGYAEKCNNEMIANVLAQISKRKNAVPDDDCLSQSKKFHKKSLQEETKTVTEKQMQITTILEKNKQPILQTASDTTVFSPEEINVFQTEYQEQLKEMNKLDFDDMIGKCLSLLQNNPELLKHYQNCFRYILVDEFQDINLPQYQVIKLLAGKEANLFVVGDDDQAIYGFRGATPGIMQQFLSDYPECTQMMLTENYRCGEKIVKLAGKVIARNTNRFQKEFLPVRNGGFISYKCLETRKEEEEMLTKEVKGLPQEDVENAAVILRTNREVFQYKELLKSAKIAVKEQKVPDDNIFRGFLLEDIISYLKFLYEGRMRTDFIKFMNKPEHYFSRLSLLEERVNKEGMKAYYEQNAAMKREIDKFFGQLSVAADLSPYTAVSFYRKTIGYERYVKQKAGSSREYQRLISQLDQIQELLKSCSGKIKAEEFFREKEAEAGGQCETSKITRGISVITMHGAKGLEFEHVFLPDVNEGVIPGKTCITTEALEEERRLLYVAITRAKNNLHIYCTKERNRKPSSFLQGIILPQ